MLLPHEIRHDRRTLPEFCFHLPSMNQSCWRAIGRLVPLFALCGSLAHGHDPTASYATALLKPDGLELQVKIAADSAWPLVQDTVAPGAIFVREDFDTVGRLQLLAFAKIMEEMSAQGKTIAPLRLDVAVVDDNFIFTLDYPRPPQGTLQLKENYLRQMPSDYVSNITVLDQNEKPLASAVLNPTDNTLEMTIPASAAAPSRGPSPTFRAFLQLGIEHMLGGYDHLLFLCGLLVVCRRLSTVLTIITCFAVAHSLTLALSTLNVVSLPSRIAGPLIAVSIVFVGIENLVRHGEPGGRWALALGFGLVHGFGFASALREIGLGSGGASILAPLFSYNLGIEIGQIAVALVIFPLLWMLRRQPKLGRIVTPAVSILVALLGGYWLLLRTFFS